MIKSKAIDLVKTLNQRDFRLLGDFLNSPIHNKNTRLIGLYDILKEYYPGLDNDTLTKELIYNRLHPGKSYQDNIMRKILSSFYVKIQDFLALVNFTNDKLGTQKHLFSELNKRNASRFFEENYKAAGEILSFPYGADDQLDYKYNIELEKNLLNIKNNKFLPDENILNESEYLIKLFLVKILRRYAYLLNKRVYEINIDINFSFLDEILKHLKNNRYGDIPAIPLYFNIIKLMLEENNELYFKAINEILGSHGNTLDRLDLYNTYIILNNYYLKKRDGCTNNYIKELMRLYKLQLDKALHKFEEYMHPALFLNIVKAGTRLKEFEWTGNFIEKHINEIDPCYRDNTDNFARAVLSFFKGDYNLCMEFLGNMKFNGYFHRLDVYTYMLRVYYEQNDIEPLINMVDSFRHILAKDRSIPAYKKSEYKSFIKFISHIVKMRHTGDYSSLGLLKKELEKIHLVSCTGWFMEKFKMLEVQFFTQTNPV